MASGHEQTISPTRPNMQNEKSTALRNPNPPRARGSEALALTVACAAEVEIPKIWDRQPPTMLIVSGGKLQGEFGTNDPEMMARAKGQCNNIIQADCTSSNNGIISRRVSGWPTGAPKTRMPCLSVGKIPSTREHEG